MLLVKNGGWWPAKLHIVVTVRATSSRKAIYRSPLGSRFIEESSIEPPTTLIISALQGARAHHNNYMWKKEGNWNASS